MSETIEDVAAPLRRFVTSRMRDPHDVDDVVQETLTRLLAAESRLEGVTLTAYAFTVARNLIATHHREAELARRHAPRLVDTRDPDRPEALALAAEDRRALGMALADLPSPARERLVDHVVHDEPLTGLAGEQGAAPSALAAQLNRTRARLRVDYLLALRRVTPPTPRCRPVLLAVSAGDRRRQQALEAGSHLLECPVCGDLSEPLLQRQRALAGVLPWIPLGALHGRVVEVLRRHPAASAAGIGSAVVAAVVATLVATGLLLADGPASVVTNSGPPASRAPGAAAPGADAAASVLVGPEGAVLPMSDRLGELAGQQVQAAGVMVLAVPADEGFWVGEGAGARVWVRLVTPGGAESALTVKAGQRLSFSALVVANPPGFPASLALTDAQGATELAQQGAHLQVAAEGVTVTS